MKRPSTRKLKNLPRRAKQKATAAAYKVSRASSGLTRKVDRYVKKEPYKAIGLAVAVASACVGSCVGYLVHHRE